jgi:hypothetical protein
VYSFLTILLFYFKCFPDKKWSFCMVLKKKSTLVICAVSSFFVSFRCISFRFVSFRFVSFRFRFSHKRSKNNQWRGKNQRNIEWLVRLFIDLSLDAFLLQNSKRSTKVMHQYSKYRFVVFRFVLWFFISFRFVSFYFVSFLQCSLRFVVFRFGLWYFISFRFVSSFFVSFRCILFRFVSFRFVSFSFLSLVVPEFYFKLSIKDPKTINEGVKINEILSG